MTTKVTTKFKSRQKVCWSLNEPSSHDPTFYSVLAAGRVCLNGNAKPRRGDSPSAKNEIGWARERRAAGDDQ